MSSEQRPQQEQLAVVYRWRVKPGFEQQFDEGWELLTRAIRTQCGSFGSRLHVTDDGLRVAYARWPDAVTRAACQPVESRGSQLMTDAIERSYDEIAMTISVDLLAEPS